MGEGERGAKAREKCNKSQGLFLHLAVKQRRWHEREKELERERIGEREREYGREREREKERRKSKGKLFSGRGNRTTMFQGIGVPQKSQKDL